MLKQRFNIMLVISAILMTTVYQGFSDDSVKRNYQRIIPLDSEIYSLIEIITIESGKSLLSDIKPWSEAEVLNVLSQFNTEDLSEARKMVFNRIKELLEKTPVYSEDNFAADVSVETTMELYLHTAEDESEWQYGYEHRLPVFSLPIEVWFNDNFYGYFKLELKESRFLITAVDNNGRYTGNISNIPRSFAECAYHFPFRAFISSGGSNWNFQIGRDQLEYGNGETGKLLLSSYSDYYDFMKLKGFADNFSFTWTYVNLESWSTLADDDGYQKAFVDHVFEIRPFDMLSLYVNESIILYVPNPEIQFVNPLTIYHNLFIRENANSMMTLGFDLIPIPGVNLYGEYALDQLQTTLEQDLYGEGVTATPNADGHMFGVKAVLPIGPGYLSGNFEYVYTSPWLYIREVEQLSFIWSHRETTDVLKARVFVKKPLGYLYGPDTIVFSGNIEYSLPGTFSAGLGIDYIMKGENTIETGYRETEEAALMKTPSGTAENILIFDIAGEYHFFPFFSVRANVCFLNISNWNHQLGASFFDFQNALSLIFKI